MLRSRGLDIERESAGHHPRCSGAADRFEMLRSRGSDTKRESAGHAPAGLWRGGQVRLPAAPARLEDMVLQASAVKVGCAVAGRHARLAFLRQVGARALEQRPRRLQQVNLWVWTDCVGMRPHGLWYSSTSSSSYTFTTPTITPTPPPAVDDLGRFGPPREWVCVCQLSARHANRTHLLEEMYKQLVGHSADSGAAVCMQCRGSLFSRRVVPGSLYAG
eukprot:354427-Chlamydomonas_euryale.AAC.3